MLHFRYECRFDGLLIFMNVSAIFGLIGVLHCVYRKHYIYFSFCMLLFPRGREWRKRKDSQWRLHVIRDHICIYGLRKLWSLYTKVRRGGEWLTSTYTLIYDILKTYEELMSSVVCQHECVFWGCIGASHCVYREHFILVFTYNHILWKWMKRRRKNKCWIWCGIRLHMCL